jgi:5-methylcytosine-specific restriction endonuclease McrA
MKARRFPKAILDVVKTIKGKRSRIVVDHILRHGSITTEDLEKYGYKHPPRAVRDVREQGLPLERFWTTSSDGRRIAGYRFGDLHRIRRDRLGGRAVFSKGFHKQVCDAHSSCCAICLTPYELRYLQLDHRIPYEVVGETGGTDIADYMPLCGSCNRAKSWSCEHCDNWAEQKDPTLCSTCYWARPERYEHISLCAARRLDITWLGDEAHEYDHLKRMADGGKKRLPDFVKEVLRLSVLKQGAEREEPEP